MPPRHFRNANRPLCHNLAVLRTFCSVSSPPPAAETLVSSVVSILKHHRSKSRWNEIFSLCPAGFTPAEFTQITLRLRNTPHLALCFFHFTLRRSLCPHSLSSYSTIIHTLARSRLKLQALTLIRSALRRFPDDTLSSFPNSPKIFETLVKTYRECDSAPFVFDLLIEACLRSKRIDQAIEITRLLHSRGISPTTSTCNLLIQFVSKCNGCFSSYDLYKEVFGGARTPNVHSFNAILLAFYQEGFRENMEGIWGEIEKQGIEPNAYSYSILMAAYCEDGKMGEAMKFWEEMGMKSLKHDAVAYNTMIGGFCRIGEVQRAEEFFMEMELNGVESSCVTFEHLINGYCKIGDLESALLLYKDMCRRGLRPEGLIVDAMVRGLCAKNRVFEALEFLKAAMRMYEIVPKGKSYEVLIKGLCAEGRMEEALKLQAEMVGKGSQPTSEIYGAFIDGFTKEGNGDIAEKLKKELLEIQNPMGKIR